MSKTKNSIFNAISMLTNTLVISILGLVSTNIIIKNYGSDVNGVVATANQIVNLLLILEGGFTLAVNVALYKPYVLNKYSLINKILSTAKYTFFRIGAIFFCVGLIISLIYPSFIKSDLDYLTIFLIFFMVIISTTSNLFFTIRHQIMFQVSQKEYIYTFISIIINILCHLTIIFLAIKMVDIIIIRLFVLLYSLLCAFIIFIFYKKKFPYVKTNLVPNNKLINGTNDLLIQKLTSVVYFSFPLLFISTFVSTRMSSVYVVYNSIYNIIRNAVNSIISAPVNAFGQLISNNKIKQAFDRFVLYEYIVVLFICVLLSVTLCLIIPFVKLYTINISEINYVNPTIAFMLAIAMFFELIHIPSGHIINVSGKFKVSKNINIVVCSILIILLIILGIKFGIYGILFAIIVSNIILAILEMGYVHFKVFSSNLNKIGFVIFINIMTVIFILFLCNKFSIVFYSYFDFIKYAIVIFMINSIFIFVINFVFFGKMIKEIFSLLKNVLRNRIVKVKI